MYTEFSKIKNIIFDLGAVIINLDLNRTYQPLAEKAKLSNEALKNLLSHPLWHRHEKGEIDDISFFNLLCEEFHLNLSYAEFIPIWNALLLDIPKERIQLLQQLSKKYNLYLLSNTNALHMHHIHQLVHHEFGLPDLDTLFLKSYYSYQMGLRKPDSEIYNFVLSDANITASETLFIDDNLDNIVSANKLGINCIHLQTPLTLTEVLQYA